MPLTNSTISSNECDVSKIFDKMKFIKIRFSSKGKSKKSRVVVSNDNSNDKNTVMWPSLIFSNHDEMQRLLCNTILYSSGSFDKNDNNLLNARLAQEFYKKSISQDAATPKISNKSASIYNQPVAFLIGLSSSGAYNINDKSLYGPYGEETCCDFFTNVSEFEKKYETNAKWQKSLGITTKLIQDLQEQLQTKDEQMTVQNNDDDQMLLPSMDDCAEESNDISTKHTKDNGDDYRQQKKKKAKKTNEKKVVINETKNEVQSYVNEQKIDTKNRNKNKRKGPGGRTKKNITTHTSSSTNITFDSHVSERTTAKRNRRSNVKEETKEKVTSDGGKTYYSAESQHSSPSFSISSKDTTSSNTTSPSEIEMPNFENILRNLMKHFPVKSKGNKYKLQTPTITDKDDSNTKADNMIKLHNQQHFNNGTFDTMLDLRKYFCAYGIGNAPKYLHNTELLNVIEAWIRYVIVPCLRQPNTISRPDAIDGKTAWKLLTKLGFRYSGKYVMPNVSLSRKAAEEDISKVFGVQNVNWFERQEDLYAMLCRFGLPSNCTFSEVTELECLQLELFLVTCEPQSVFHMIEYKETDPKILSDNSSGLGPRPRVYKQIIASPIPSPHSQSDAISVGSRVMEVEEVTAVPAATTSNVHDVSSSSGKSKSYVEKVGKATPSECAADSTAATIITRSTTSPEHADDEGSTSSTPSKSLESAFASVDNKRVEEETALHQNDVEDMKERYTINLIPDTEETDSIPITSSMDEQAAMTGDEECTPAAIDTPESEGSAKESNKSYSKHEIIRLARERMKEKGVKIQKNGNWKDVMNSLGDSGWVYVQSKYLKAPDGKTKNDGGILGIDFFSLEEDLYDVKDIAVKHFGWGGNAKYWEEQKFREGSSKRSRRSSSPQPETKTAVPTVDTIKKPEYRKKRKSQEDSGKQESQANKKRKEEVTGQPSSSEALTVPEEQKTVSKKLKSCLNVLQTSSRIDSLAVFSESTPTNSNGETSFTSRTNEIKHFLRGVVNSRGTNESTSLYVCGRPGTGKTSVVTWCCNEIKKEAGTSCSPKRKLKKKDLEFLPKFCFINGADSQRENSLLDLLAESLKMKSKPKRIDDIERLIKNSKNAASKQFLIVVIDEIDLLLSERKSDGIGNSSEKVLSKFVHWAHEKDFAFSLIGISNVVLGSNTKARRLQSLGNFTKTITFPAYNKEDLIAIVEQRIGRTIVDPVAVEFISKKVSASNGDARAMLDLTSNAISKCLSSLPDKKEKGGATSTKGSEKLDQPIVKLKHVMAAIRDSNPNIAKHIDGLPHLGKVILCVAMTLSKVGSAWKVMKLGTLKRYCIEALQGDSSSDMYEPHELALDVFWGLVQQLCDTGLLCMSYERSLEQATDEVSRFESFELNNMPISLKVQLEDVDSALYDTLGNKEIYRKLMDYVRENDLGNRG